MDRPLYSQRAGRGRDISVPDLARLVWRGLILWAREVGLFAEAFDRHQVDDDQPTKPALVGDVDAFLLDALHTSRVDRADLTWSDHPPSAFTVDRDEDLLFDLLELLHDRCVSLPADLLPSSTTGKIGVGPFDREGGRQLFRERLNPMLAKHSPPLEMLSNGHINELPAEGLRELVHDPIPDSVEPEIRDPLLAATDRFYRRGATRQDRVAALRDLAGVLERLRPEIKREMFSKDEDALFEIANKFSIRHHDRAQRGNYDSDVWLEWIFHVYLATAKAMLGVHQRDREQRPEPDELPAYDDDPPF